MAATNDRDRFNHAVLLDRDGVINVEIGDYTTTRDQWEWATGALEGLKLLTEAGFRCIVITNQACIAKGRQTEENLAELHAWMREQVIAAGGIIAAVYHCPHQTSDGCGCRKPMPGMILEAAAEHRFILPETFFIGDTARDMEAARRAGTRTILIKNDRNAYPPPGNPGPVDFTAADLQEAAHIVIDETRMRYGLNSG